MEGGSRSMIWLVHDVNVMKAMRRNLLHDSSMCVLKIVMVKTLRFSVMLAHTLDIRCSMHTFVSKHSYKSCACTGFLYILACFFSAVDPKLWSFNHTLREELGGSIPRFICCKDMFLQKLRSSVTSMLLSSSQMMSKSLSVPIEPMLSMRSTKETCG